MAQHLAALRAERVSVLFNEPKLLKSAKRWRQPYRDLGFSALQRAEIAEINRNPLHPAHHTRVSVLFNEPKLLKYIRSAEGAGDVAVSVLFNEPKLLK